MRLRFTLAAALCASVADARLALAADATAEAQLVYVREGADTCPDEEGLRDAVAARLGYDPFVRVGPAGPVVPRGAGAPGSAPPANRGPARVIHATMRRGRRGAPLLRAEVEVKQGGRVTGTRVLTSNESDCRELASTVAFAISIAIDPDVALRAPQGATPTSERNAPADAQATSTPAPAPADAVIDAGDAPAEARGAASKRNDSEGTPRDEAPVARFGAANAKDTASRTDGERFRIRLGAGLFGAFGATPSPGWGGSVSAAIAWRRASLWIEARADAPTEIVDEGASARAGLFGALAGPCLHLGPALGCAFGGVVSLSARGSGTDITREGSQLFAVGVVRLAIDVALTKALALQPRLDAMVPFAEGVLRLRGRDVWTTPPLSAALGLSLVGTLP